MLRARAILSTIAVLAAAFVIASAARADPRNVLLVTDTRTSPAQELINAGVRRTLLAADDVELYEQPLDIARFSTLDQQAVVADFLRARFADRHIDAVLASGPASLAFLAKRRAELFPSSPIVYAAVRATSVPADLVDATGVVSSFDLVKTLELAFALQPDARRLVVISGAAELDVSWNSLARSLLEPYRERMDVIYLEGLSKAELLEAVSQLPRDTIVAFLTMRQDGAGEVFEDMRSLAREISAAATAPIYSVYETFVGEGAVGGYVESFEGMGEAMALLTLRLLRGERAADISPLTSPKAYAVDWRALRRWGLDEAHLPPDSTVLFRDPSLWTQYRVEILGGISVVALQTLLIVALLLYIRNRRVERTLLQTEDRYRHVVEAQIDLICRYTPDTTLTFVNETYCRYFGRVHDELIGRRFIELIPENERQNVLERVQTVVDETRTVSYTHQVTAPDGSVRWQQWLDHPVTDAAGKVVEIEGIGRDITELKAAELEAKQRREQVTHLTRVAILGELSGALAHELNQPMTAILTNAQTAERLLQRESPDLAELRDIIKDIVADDIRAGEVIRRLRAMLKPGATAFQAVDVAALIAEVLGLLRAQLVEQHVTVVERFSAPLPRVNGDRIQLQQVLLNLLMNACEAMRDAESSERTLVARASHDNGFVTVSIIDRGPGLSPNVAERLFEPFFTTKREGLGLGLSICRSIVSLHNGTISARNNSDGGATVELALPVVAAELERPQQNQSADWGRAAYVPVVNPGIR